MDTNKLIKSLKFCANMESSKEDCNGCPRWGFICVDRHCVDDLLMQAATAIEAMQQTLYAQQQRIAEQEDTVVHQRLRADAAETFICKLCTECEWEDHNGITIMQRKCGCLFPIECGKFKLAAAEDLRLALTQLRQGCCDTCKHEALDADEYPCNLCSYAGGGSSQWVWAKPEVDNGKQ